MTDLLRDLPAVEGPEVDGAFALFAKVEEPRQTGKFGSSSHNFTPPYALRSRAFTSFGRGAFLSLGFEPLFAVGSAAIKMPSNSSRFAGSSIAKAEKKFQW